MVLDRASRDHEAVGDLGVSETLGEKREHVQLASREICGILPRGRSRAAWHGRTPLPQSLAYALCRWASTEVLEDVERFAERVLVVALRKRARRLVRTTSSGPGRGGSGRVSADLASVRLGDPARRAFASTCFPLPVGEFACEPNVSPLHRERVHAACFLERLLPIACQPGGLRPCRGNEREPLELAARLGHLQRTIEWPPDVGIATSGSDLPEHRQCKKRRHAGSPGGAEHEIRGVGGRGPLPPVEQQSGSLGTEALPEVSELAISAVLEAGVQITIDDLVIS